MTATPEEAVQQERRDFLLGLGRWSKAAIAVAVFGGVMAPGADVQAGAWVNRRGGAVVRGGGGWVNGGGGGGSWANRRGAGGWANGRY
ncbi:hypothetical protein CCR91_00140 [Thiorhodovibrio winogradskyi]|nr:hypothetical protein [Thiorhodovibrio winogradskyi]